MSKYVITNCPAFDEGDCTSPTEHIPYATACKHIEDCKLKQIIELCKNLDYRSKDLYELGKTNMALDIMGLLDIQGD